MTSDLRERAVTSRPSSAWQVEVRASVDDITGPEFDALCGADRPLWSRGLLRAMESGGIGPADCRYICVLLEGRLVALLPVYHFPALDLLGLLGRSARSALAGVARLAPRLLTIDALFAGHLLGEGGAVREAGQPAGPLADLLFDALASVARERGARWVVWKDLSSDSLAALRDSRGARRFTALPALPDAVLTLPAGTFEQFVGALPGKPRRNTRAKLRRLAASGMTLTEIDDMTAIAEPLAALYRQVLDRAESWLEVLTPEFLAALSGAEGVRSRAVVAWRDGVPAGFLLFLTRGRGAAALRVGLDYEHSSEGALYHAVHLRGIDLALQEGCTEMDFFQTAYEPKEELGCHLVGLTNLVTHRNPLMRAMVIPVIRRLVAN